MQVGWRPAGGGGLDLDGPFLRWIDGDEVVLTSAERALLAQADAQKARADADAARAETEALRTRLAALDAAATKR